MKIDLLKLKNYCGKFALLEDGCYSCLFFNDILAECEFSLIPEDWNLKMIKKIVDINFLKI